MAATLLIYHMEESRTQAVEGLCEALGIRPVRVEESSHAAPVGLLSGTADPRELLAAASGRSGSMAEMTDQNRILPKEGQTSSRAIDEEMIVMSEFTEKQFHALLDGLKEIALRISLKAVETPVNRYWTGEMLQEELKRERQAVRR